MHSADGPSSPVLRSIATAPVAPTRMPTANTATSKSRRFISLLIAVDNVAIQKPVTFPTRCGRIVPLRREVRYAAHPYRRRHPCGGWHRHGVRGERACAVSPGGIGAEAVI